LLRTLGSIKIAGVLFALIAAACVVGTLIPQSKGFDYYSEHYGAVGAHVIMHPLVRVSDVFHSWWFIGALGVFGLNLAACTIVHRPQSLRRLGFLLTHAGVLVVLIGALAGMIGTKRGRLVLRPGETKSSYPSSRAPSKSAYASLAKEIKGLAGQIAELEDAAPESWATEHGFLRYFHPANKALAGVTWSDGNRRLKFLHGIVADANRLLELSHQQRVALGQSSTAAASLDEAERRLMQTFADNTTEGTDFKRREEPLGFAVRLDDFRIERYAKPAQLVVKLGGHVEAQAIDVEAQKPVKVGYDCYVDPADRVDAGAHGHHNHDLHSHERYQVQVLKVIPDFAEEPDAREDPAAPFAPAVQIETDAAEQPLILRASDADGFTDQDGSLYIAYKWLQGGVALQQALADVLSRKEPTLLVSAGGEQRQCAASPGSTCELPGGGIKVEVLGYFERFQRDQTGKSISNPNAPLNPCAQVAVTAAGERRVQYVFAKFPDFGMGHGEAAATYRLRLLTPEGLGANCRVFILEGERAERRIAQVAGDRILSIHPLAVGQQRSIEGTEHTLRLLGAYRRPRFKRIVSRSNEFVNPAALLRISGPQGEVQEWSAMAGPPIQYPDGKLLVRYVLPAIKTYRSQVTILKGGAAVTTAQIEVNTPFSYGGFTFYQAVADHSQPPRWTGLDVVNDPGSGLVYVGLILVTAGVIYIFAIKPLLQRKESK